MISCQDQGIVLEMGPLILGPWQPTIQVDRVDVPMSVSACPTLREGEAICCLMSGREDLAGHLEVRLEADELLVRCVLANRGTQSLALGRWVLLDAPVRQWAQPGDQVTLLLWPMSGRQNVHGLNDPGCPTQGRVKMQLANLSRDAALQVGFVTYQRSDTQVGLTLAEDRKPATLWAACDMAGWELAPGEETASEWLRIAVGKDPQVQLTDWANRVAAWIQPRIWDEAPIGYLGWSWTDTNNGPENYQTVILQQLDAVNERLAGLGIRYLWTSMANIKDGMPGNWLLWGDEHIPMGREAFLHEVARRGFIQGFWVAPFYLGGHRTAMLDRLKDALLQEEGGSPLVVCDHWRYGSVVRLPLKQRPPLYALDPSHPKTLAFLREVFETYRAWGVRYFMLDFLEAGAGAIHRFPYARHHDRSLVAGADVYVQCMKMIRDVVGPDTFLLSSTGPILHNAGLVDSVRVGNDFGEGRSINPEAFFYPASFVINQFSFWTSASFALSNHAASAHTHRKLYINNSANVLTIDQPLSLSEAHIAATLHGMSGGGSMLGDDLRHISDERLAIIKKTLPRGQGAARALDLFSSPQPIGPRIFHQHIRTGWQTYDVVALYNLDGCNPNPKAVQLDFSRLGIGPDACCHLWDFWDERYLGVASGEVTVHLAPGSVRVLRITPALAQPTLVATNMHLLMGEVEILDATYDPQAASFYLKATRPAGDMGAAFIHVPLKMFVQDIGHLHIAKHGPDETLIIGVPMRFDEQGQFERLIHFGFLEETLDMRKMNLA